MKILKIKNKAEVVIVGGGVGGCSLAYYLAKAGIDVVVVERNFLASGATGACPGGIRQQYGSERKELIILARESVKLFETLDDELDYDTEFTQKGYLLPIVTEEEQEGYKENLKAQRALDVNVRFLHSDEVREQEPLLNVDGVGIIGANFCQEDGTANPFRVTHGYAKAAESYGAQFYTYTEVKAIAKRKGKITAVKTSRGDINTSIVVNVAGGNSRDIAEMAGIQLPTLPLSSENIASEPMAPVLKTLTYARNTGPSSPGIFIHQTKHGEIIGPGRERLGHDTLSTFQYMKIATSKVARYFPKLKHMNILRMWTGVQDYSPDLFPILGPTDGVEMFIQQNGLSGHGFMISPICSKLNAEFIAKGRITELHDLFERLNLRRFQGSTPLTEEIWRSRTNKKSRPSQL